MRKRDEMRDPICIKRGRGLAVLGGAGAALVAFASGSAAPLVIALGAVAAMLAVSGLIPIPEGRRPYLCLALGTAVVLLALATRQSALGATVIGATLAVASGLILRGKRTRSWSARILVGLGLTGAIAWLGTAGMSGVVMHSFGILDVLPALLSLSLLLVLALVLLAFVDEHGPSGAGYIGTAMLVWAGLEAVIAAWSGDMGTAGAGALAAAMVAPAVSIALAQVLGGRVGPDKSARPAHEPRVRPAE